MLLHTCQSIESGGKGISAYLFNSVFASLVSTAIAMVLGIPAAYGMVFQMRKKSSNGMLFFVLSTRFMSHDLFLAKISALATGIIIVSLAVC